MKNNKHAQVFHFDVFGKRLDKYDFLENHSIASVDWKELDVKEPSFYFIQKNFTGSNLYEIGFKLDQLLILNANGIKTQRDDASIKFTQKECQEIKHDFLNVSKIELIKKYNFKDVRDWTIDYAKLDLKNNPIIADKIDFRPFDLRCMNYTGKTKGVMGYPRFEIMKHLLKANIAILLPRQAITEKFGFFVTNKICDINYTGSAGQFGAGLVFPLYLYPETNAQQTIGQTTERTPNLNSEIVKQLAEKLSLTFVPEKEPEGNVCYINNPEVRPDFKTTFAPIDILDYIYAVLHSPTYREKYKEFLKIDFPRVPYPKDAETFWQLVELGGEIRQIHLLNRQR
jgi:predicted helicase